MITKDMTLADVVKAHPNTIGFLNGLHLDYCCGGHEAISIAIREKGMDVEKFLAELNEVAARPTAAKDVHADIESFKDLKVAEMLDDLEATPHVTDRRHLAEHFSGCQIAHAAFQRGSAKTAAHAAAHLGGQTQRIAVVVAHDHAFDEIAVQKLVQQLFGIVNAGAKMLADGHGIGHGALFQPRAQRGGQIGHFRNGRAARQPLAHLPGAKSGAVKFPQKGRQFLLREGQKLRALHFTRPFCAYGR